MLNEQASKDLYALVDPLADSTDGNFRQAIDAILVSEENQLPKNILNQLIGMYEKASLSMAEVNALRVMVFLTPYPLFDSPRMIKLGFSLIASGTEAKNVMLRLAAIGEIERRTLPENVQKLLHEIDFIVEDESEGFGDIEIPATFDIGIVKTF